MNKLLMVGALVVMTACAGKDAPVGPARLVVGEGREIGMTIVSTATIIAPDGSKQVVWRGRRHSVATMVGGMARVVTPASYDGGSARQSASFAQATTTVVAPADLNLAPLLAIADGDFLAPVDEIDIALDGSVIRTVGYVPGNGTPLNYVVVYVNGDLRMSSAITWNRVTGGYTLGTQTLTGYVGGQPVSTTASVALDIDPLGSAAPSTATRLAVFGQRKLHDLGCALGRALGPKVAYAAPYRCIAEGADFAAATFLEGAATLVTWNPIGAAAFVIGWYPWTRSLYLYLNCLQRRK